MIYQVNKASKYYGATVVFEDVNFEIKNTEKIALVGRNGSGKTTFLRCISGEEDFDEANVNKANATTIGYLAQKVIEDEGLSVKEELMKNYTHIFEVEAKLRELEEKMKTNSDDSTLKEYAELQEELEMNNGYTWESEMNTVFSKFGFTKDDLDKRINEFSGGQKTRIAFVKLLLSKPDILLLDEPTNHLDVDAIEWLENYIRNYPKAVVVVSHDRMFLDRVVSVVYELEFNKMKRYAGNYSAYVTQKKNDLDRLEQAYKRQQKDIERLEQLIEKFRYKKNKAKFAQSKIKYLDRMDKISLEKVDDKTFHAKFTPKLKGGERVLELDSLKIGYDKPLAQVTMSVRRGDRVAIIGSNGTGKSTLMKTLVEQIPSLGGDYLFGHQIEVGYFDQQLAQFSSGKTVLEELWDEYPDLDRTTIRSVLGQFLFSADDVFKTVDVLSGGEKVRLSLSKLLLKHANLLLLDEPTNHLDIPGKEALEESLKDYEGTLIFVSHDRYFIKELATSLLLFDDEGVKYIPMSYSEYYNLEENKVKEEKKVEAKIKEVKRREKPLSKEGKERLIKKLEKEITAKEEELEEMRELRFEPEFYQDQMKMRELDERIDDIHNEIANLMKEWEELSE